MPHDFTSARLAGALRGWHRNKDPLYRNLAGAVRDLIERGVLPPHTRLPSERSLAVTLSVSRGTVTAAYELLRSDDYVTTQHGSGTLVNPGRSPLTGPRESHLAAVITPASSPVAPADDGLIDLVDAVYHQPVGTRGAPHPPTADFSEMAGSGPEAPWNGDAYGRLELRRLVATHLTGQGLPTVPEELLITGGGQQALALVMMAHVGRKDRVILEELTYPGALHAALLQEGIPVRIRRRSACPDLDELASAIVRWAPRALYVMATGHSTDGGVMSASARRRLADLACASGLLVIDDMSMAPTTTRCLAPPPLAAFADDPAARRFITIGSLGKTLGPDHRLGWVRARPEQLDRLAHVQAVIGVAAPDRQQAHAEHLLSAPDLFARQRQEAAERRAHMAASLAQALPEWQVAPADAGMSLWVHLPTEVTGFLPAAHRLGVRLAPPSVTSAAIHDGRWLRLAVGHPGDRLEEASERLAEAWRAHRRTSSRSSPWTSRIAG